MPLGKAEELASVAKPDFRLFGSAQKLLDLERQHRSMARRAGLFKALEQSLRRGSYDSIEEATATAMRRRDMLDELRDEDNEASMMLPLTATAPGMAEGTAS